MASRIGCPRRSPIASAVALMLAGTALSLWRPKLLELPKSERSHRSNSTAGQALTITRDAVQDVAPDNLSDSIGKSLAVTGSALLIVGIFDALLDASDERA